MTVSQTLLVFDDWTALEGVCLVLFSGFDRGDGLGEEDHRGEGASDPITSRVHAVHTDDHSQGPRNFLSVFATGFFFFLEAYWDLNATLV